MLGEQATPPSLDAGRLLASQDWAACFQSMVCTITKFTLPSGKLPGGKAVLWQLGMTFLVYHEWE